MERVTEVYYSDGYTPDDLIHYFWMNFTIDTLGRCVDLEIPDTCRRQTIIVWLLAQGCVLRPKGRPRKSLENEEAQRNHELAKLRMQVELLRNFLLEVGRR